MAGHLVGLETRHEIGQRLRRPRGAHAHLSETLRPCQPVPKLTGRVVEEKRAHGLTVFCPKGPSACSPSPCLLTEAFPVHTQTASALTLLIHEGKHKDHRCQVQQVTPSLQARACSNQASRAPTVAFGCAMAWRSRDEHARLPTSGGSGDQV